MVSQGEKFAIAAEGDDTGAQLSHLTGIAPFFHVYDESGNLLEVLPNEFLKLEYGTGPAAATMLADHGVTVLVGGMAGPKMADVLEARNVRFVYRSAKKNSVQNVVDELRQ